nr:peroxisomal fatty acid beta-oxidation multifunctional protein AIM1-like isoform X1 [Ipomoea batatas]
MGSNSTPVAMEIGSDGIAVITLSNPPVNALTLSVIAELKQCYQEAMERDDVKAVVLTGTGGKFCGGLDIDIMRKIHKTDSTLKQEYDIFLGWEEFVSAISMALEFSGKGTHDIFF